MNFIFSESIEDYNSIRYNELENNEIPMTFILGAKCSDGVVMVADRKVTIDCGVDFDYTDKLHGVLKHIIFGVSGSPDSFELLKGQAMDYVRTYPPGKKVMTVDNIINKLSKFTYDINKKYKFSNLFAFDVLVGIQYNNQNSSLTYISQYGTYRPIDDFRIIGTGGRYAKIFMKKIWNKEMRMEEVAELGYFIIKYIENFGLDNTVGVNDSHPEIWYIPNKYTNEERNDIHATEEQLEIFHKRTERRLFNHESHLKELFI
jgi:20S proteasome alpha/beta subunit